MLQQFPLMGVFSFPTTPKWGSASFVFFRSARSCSLVVQPFTEGVVVDEEFGAGIETWAFALLDKFAECIFRKNTGFGCFTDCHHFRLFIHCLSYLSYPDYPKMGEYIICPRIPGLPAAASVSCSRRPALSDPRISRRGTNQITSSVPGTARR